MKTILKSIAVLTALFFTFNNKAVSDPVLVVTPNAYTFDNTYIGQTTSAMFTFANTGTEAVVVTDITFTDPAFSIDYTAFTIGPGESGELPIYFSPGSAGVFEGTMQIFSNDPVNNPYEVQLTGTGSVELIDGWQWIQTPYDYIYYDMEFPEGQNQIGYCVGQANTYNGEGIVVKTTDGGDTWTQMTPSGTFWLTAISFIDVNTGFVGGMGGDLLKTVDGGQTWTNVTVQSDIYKIMDVEFRDENNGVVATIGSGVYVTNDGGQTWTQASGVAVAPMMVTYVNDSIVVGVGNEDRIMRSTDGGYSWTEVYSTGISDYILLGVYFLNDQYGMATGDYGHVYTTNDGGENWTMNIPGYDDILHTPFIWDEDTAWIAGTPEVVYKTTDGGASWNVAYNGNFERAFYRITFTDNYTGFICGSHGVVLRKAGLDGPILNVEPNPVVFEDTYLGNSTSVMVTFANNGNEPLNVSDITFSDPAFSIDYTSFTIEPGESGELPVTFTPSTEGLVEATMQIYSDDLFNDPYEVQLQGTGAIFYNMGWQWIQTPFDYILTDMEFPEGQNQTGYCVGQANTYNGEGIVIKTTDGGDTWEQMTPAGTLWLTGISFPTIDTGYVCGMGGDILKTTDGGQTWTPMTVQSNIYKIKDVEFRDVNHGVATTIGDGIYVTEDGGQNWTAATGYSVEPNMIDYADDMTLIGVGGEDRIQRSTDGGYTWTEVYSTGIPDNILLGVYFLNSDYGMAAGDYGHVYKTTDGGLSWTMTIPASDDLLHTPFIWDEDTSWVVGTPEFVYKSTDGGNSWVSAYNGNYDRAFYRILFTNNYTGFICGSHGVVLRKQGYPEIPEISVTPQSLNFGEVSLGDSLSLTVNVKNTGFGTLDIYNIFSTNNAFTTDLTSFSLDPTQDQMITVTFAPDEQGTFSGMLQIMSNDPENNVITVNLNGSGVAPAINVYPEEIVFDTTLVNETATETVTISNLGQAVLSISDITTSDNVFSVNTTSFDLGPNETMNVEVTFAPVEQMLYTGTLTIESNDPENSTVEVQLSGYSDLGTGKPDLSFDDAVKVYPNPVRDLLFIENVKDADIVIYDLFTKVRFSQKANSNTQEIDVSSLENGIYLIRISSQNKVITKKIEIAR